MKPIVRSLVVLGIGMLSLVPTGSFAADGDTTQGSIVEAPPVAGKSGPNPAYVREKLAMAGEYAAAKAGRISAKKFQADQQRFETTWYGRSPKKPQAPVAGAQSVGSEAVASACCNSHIIAVNQYPQGDWFWCGPGAAYSTLQYLGNMTSYFGEQLTQSCLAGTCGSGSPKSLRYLETNYFVGTPWYSGGSDWPFSQALNYWRTGSYTGYYVNTVPTSVSMYQDGLTYDIDHYWPVSPDVRELAGGTHLFNHPRDKTIDHWITAHGYENYGAATDYVDPAKSPKVTWSGSVQAINLNYPSSWMYSMMRNVPFGYVW